jgi:Zn-finger nucleic acid-binding protein
MPDGPLITCPKCSTVLERFAAAGVELDHCPACGGIWLDRGELALLKLTAEPGELRAIEERGSGDRRVPPSSRTVKLPCPCCPGSMTAFSVGGAILDICPTCNGLWLDRGELEPALRAIGKQTPPAVLAALLGVLPPGKG